MKKAQTVQKNKKFLVAVDDSANSRRAVEYVGYIIGGIDGIHVTLLHVIPEPEDDYFQEERLKAQWVRKYQEKMTSVLEDYHGILTAAGIPEGAIETRMPMRHCPSMAECILSEKDDRNFGTIVVGRHGLSRQEEFLFGSISSKIINHARHCTVWVVE